MQVIGSVKGVVMVCYREAFHIPEDKNGDECVYLCGNSLGLQPKATANAVLDELDVWAKHAVEGHFEKPYPWFTYHEFVREGLAHIVGANEQEVVAMNSLTTNLHLLMVSLYRPTAQKHKIIMEGGAFPSDRYAVQSQLAFHGFDSKEGLIELCPQNNEDCLSTEYILSSIKTHGNEAALLLFSGVQYLTGQYFDMAKITQTAHDYGIIVGFDLAHAVGNVVLKLHEWDVDFAAWCSYKYLNAGPGGIGGAFIHQRHCENLSLNRFAGWWGNDAKRRFSMPDEFSPVPSADAWQLSNPPIFLLAALRSSLDIFLQTDMLALRKRGDELVLMAEELLEKQLHGMVKIITPKALCERGNQLSLKVTGDVKTINQQLKQLGVISDFRAPDVLRVAVAPLYTNERDVSEFVCRLKGLLQ
jgi:kynureninase